MSCVSFKVEACDNLVVFSVMDQGIGVSNEDMSKLFVPFPNIFIPDVSHGSGLGLSISKGIVELYEGRIWIESEGKGKGTTFSFTIPVN